MAAVADRTAPAAPAAGGACLRRDVGRTALLFTSVGSVIGSGWLLGAMNATQIGGPAAIISWVVGAVAIMLLALIHAELGGMHPVNGGMVRFPHYAFGSLVGFGMGWIYYLGSVTLAPVETEAAIQYADKWIHEAFGFHVMHLSDTNVILNGPGYAGRRRAHAPLHRGQPVGCRPPEPRQHRDRLLEDPRPRADRGGPHHHAVQDLELHRGQRVRAAGVKGILSAIATGGVVFAYLGFEQAIQFGGETRNPKRNIPFAVVGSMLIGAVVYILLEVAFLGALNPHAAAHGWAKLSFNQFGPFAAIATALGLGWLRVPSRSSVIEACPRSGWCSPSPWG